MSLPVVPPGHVAYLATPYTRYEAGLVAAYKDAAILAGRLMLVGVNVFSPIVHAHAIANFAGIDPLDHPFWINLQRPYLEACPVLIVAQMDGWQESVGIKIEMDFFTEHRKPIVMINPETLEVVKP